MCVCVCLLTCVFLRAFQQPTCTSSPSCPITQWVCAAASSHKYDCDLTFHSLTPKTTASASAPDCLQWLPVNQPPFLLICPSCYKILMILHVFNVCALYCGGFYMEPLALHRLISYCPHSNNKSTESCHDCQSALVRLPPFSVAPALLSSWATPGPCSPSATAVADQPSAQLCKLQTGRGLWAKCLAV